MVSLIAAILIGAIIGACAVQGRPAGQSAEAPAAGRADSIPRPTAAAATGQQTAGQPPAEPAPGNAENGRKLFQTLACNSCHAVPGMGASIIGPALDNIGAEASTMRPGYTAGQYLVESILAPNAFITPGYQPNLMPATYTSLPATQIQDLVAFMLTLKK